MPEFSDDLPCKDGFPCKDAGTGEDYGTGEVVSGEERAEDAGASHASSVRRHLLPDATTVSRSDMPQLRGDNIRQQLQPYEVTEKLRQDLDLTALAALELRQRVGI
jgi:hypothetical protein